MTANELRQAIIRVLDVNLDLTIHGIGTPAADLTYFTSGPAHKAKHREFYDVDVAHIGRIVKWLETWPRTLAINPRGHGSYGFKHIAERDLDEYVANGEFILAARVSGIRIQRIAPRNPNVIFNLTRRGIQPCGHCGKPIICGSHDRPDSGYDHPAAPAGVEKPRSVQWRHRWAIPMREQMRQSRRLIGDSV
jgi:hypothetical protein